MKKRIRIPKQNKVRSELQKEINSVCPFCESTDVGHFQIHHISEDPSDNNFTNLMLLCPTCHSKITKGDVPKNNVIKKKNELYNKTSDVQLASITIDRNQCGWRPIEDVDNTFEAAYIDKSLYPILNFSLINNSKKTILLTSIHLGCKVMPVGLSGPAPTLPKILRPLITYKIKIPNEGDINNVFLDEEIEVPAGSAFKFQIELFNEYNNVLYPPLGKYGLYFSFKFNSDFEVKAPTVLLNCKKEYDELPIYGLG